MLRACRQRKQTQLPTFTSLPNHPRALQGLPTSIEGFKVHPLYVLKRHIGKYEVRPSSGHSRGCRDFAWAMASYI